MPKPHSLFKHNLPGDTVKAWGKEYLMAECTDEEGIPIDLVSTAACILRCETCIMPRAYCAMIACSADYRDDKRNVIFLDPKEDDEDGMQDKN